MMLYLARSYINTVSVIVEMALTISTSRQCVQVAAILNVEVVQLRNDSHKLPADLMSLTGHQ